MRRAIVAAMMLAGGVAQAAPPARPATTITVTARGETRPVNTTHGDAADDPAIWRNPARPAHSLIVATDKQAGLYVYDLDGVARDFVPAGRVNNVDLIDLGARGVIVVASDRNDKAAARLLVYRLDPDKAKLIPLGITDGGAGEAYGVCLAPHDDGFDAFSVLKHGAIHQVRITLRDGTLAGKIVRTLHLPTQTEGCVADSRTGTLYVGEEDRGIWAFPIDPSERAGQLVASVDNHHLTADVEGLTLLPNGRRGGWLIASSQGDNAYALFRLPDLQPAGRFRIGAGRFGATEETDGIAIAPGRFDARFPDGLLVVQDGQNGAQGQNFKLVSWRDIAARLERRR